MTTNDETMARLLLIVIFWIGLLTFIAGKVKNENSCKIQAAMLKVMPIFLRDVENSADLDSAPKSLDYGFIRQSHKNTLTY